MTAFAGIGSRETPPSVEPLIAKVCRHIWKRTQWDPWMLRSGGAPGADSMFERHWPGPKEIFLPWPGFNGNRSRLVKPYGFAHSIAAKFHPRWLDLKPSAQLLHARNVNQVLGRDCDDPVRFVLCWTPCAREVGGTAQAMRIAKHYGVPIVNLASYGPLVECMLLERIDELLSGTLSPLVK